MRLFRKIQLIAVATGGVLTNIIGLLQVFGYVNWTPEQSGAVALVYSSVAGMVVVAAQAFSNVEPESGAE